MIFPKTKSQPEKRYRVTVHTKAGKVFTSLPLQDEGAQEVDKAFEYGWRITLLTEDGTVAIDGNRVEAVVIDEYRL